MDEDSEIIEMLKTLPVLNKGLPGEMLSLRRGNISDSDVVPVLKPLIIDALDKLDALFLKDPQWERYAVPKNTFFENADGRYTPNLRCHIARGMADLGVIGKDDLEEKIHRMRGDDFSEAEKNRMVSELRKLEPTVGDDQLYAWLGGDVVAPKDWENFARLAKLDSHFERYYKIVDGAVVPDKEMQRQYREYNGIRSGMMWCSENLKKILYLAPAERDSMMKALRSRCSENGDKGIVAEGIGHILDHMPKEKLENSFEYVTVGDLKERMRKKKDCRNPLRTRIELTQNVIREKVKRQPGFVKNPNDIYQDFLVLTSLLSETIAIYLDVKHPTSLVEINRAGNLHEFLRALSERFMPSMAIELDNGPITELAAPMEKIRTKYDKILSDITAGGVKSIDEVMNIDPAAGYSNTSLMATTSRMIESLPYEFKLYLAYARFLQKDGSRDTPLSGLTKSARKEYIKKVEKLEKTSINKHGFKPKSRFAFDIIIKEHKETIGQYGFMPLYMKWEGYIKKLEMKNSMHNLFNKPSAIIGGISPLERLFPSIYKK
ncbi:hypothetical protein COV19_01820 [Candidatus Woesearchaeota archaeon CG10_big_fil_rev_8_21_14_0_10_44_13]|nr:MAG: hypothetical protein COV19_01820 [Candidatus Woesearchaeota archaeon CG10_big_fil_rev_8_21_14_0_10_44_13]